MKLLIFTLVTIFSISSFANQNTDTKMREALAVSLIGSTVSCEQTLSINNESTRYSIDSINTSERIKAIISSIVYILTYDQEERLITFTYTDKNYQYSVLFHTNSSFNRVESYTVKSSEVLSNVSFSGTYANPELENRAISKDFQIIECSVENKNPTDLE